MGAENVFIPQTVAVKSNVKSILKSFIHYLPIPYGVLLGGVRKKWDEYYYRITLQKIKRIKYLIFQIFMNLIQCIITP